jgi:hypothetical protein
MNANLRKKILYELKGRFGLSFGFFQVRRFTTLSSSGSSFLAAAGGSAFSATGSEGAGDASCANALVAAGSSTIGFRFISTQRIAQGNDDIGKCRFECQYYLYE